MIQSCYQARPTFLSLTGSWSWAIASSEKEKWV